MHARSLIGSAVLLLAAQVAASSASIDFRPVAELHHTAWTTEQGAPDDMYALAQTPDGWLWLGGPRGLYRFDGVQFEPVRFARRSPEDSLAVSFLFAEDSGDLWIGWLYGGVSHIGNGTEAHYGVNDGMPDTSITALGRDARGILWAATGRGLVRFVEGHWQPLTEESGFADAGASSFLLDRDGTFWIAGLENVYRVRPGQQRVERTELKTDGNVDFLTSPDGRAWYTNASGAYMLPDQVSGRARPLHANARVTRVALFDEEGSLWTCLDGVTRHAVPTNARAILLKDSAFAPFKSKDGLTSNNVHSMLEDMEGNLWVVTGGGVDRFRRTNVHKLTGADAPQDFILSSLAAGEDGAIWIGRNHGSYGPALPQDGLWKFDGRLTRAVPNVNGEVTALERERNGVLWIGGAQGIWRREPDGRLQKLPEFPAMARGQQVRDIAVDANSDPWVVIGRQALYRLHAGTWEKNGNLPELPSATPNVLTRDPEGRLWLGYRTGRIAIVKDDRVSAWLGSEQGLQVGMIAAIHVDRFTVIGGERAVAIFHNGRFHTLQATEQPTALEGVAGIAQASNGDFWFNGARGAVRVDARNLQEALRSERYIVTPELFDSKDGFPGVSVRVWPLPTLIAGTDDRLWFSGTLGIGWLDPQRLRRNPLAPPLQIRSVTSDGVVYRQAGVLRLPQGALNLQVNYTAINLSRPERVRFRYRLDGYDQGWVDAGSRRAAFYTNLPPGTYRFQVMAASETGVWSESGAAMTIEIPPTFTQTRGFLALCVIAALALLWGVYAVRVKQVTARERSRLEERLSERERIARELHDTLLQGVQGLTMKMQAVVDKSDMREASRQAMNDAIDRADELVAEARDRVKDLRSTATPGLRQQLIDVIEHLPAEQRAKLRVIEHGTPRDLHQIVSEEAVRIASEATVNALRHAAASIVEIEVAYERRSLRINVRDDGRGIEEAVLREGREGHFGLLGMRERAKRLRGELDIWSRPGSGTEVSLTVPASMAYARKP